MKCEYDLPYPRLTGTGRIMLWQYHTGVLCAMEVNPSIGMLVLVTATMSMMFFESLWWLHCADEALDRVSR